jgi:hypothetical protein
MLRLEMGKGNGKGPLKDPTGGPLDGLPTIRPSGLGDRSYTPDFESERAPGEKLREANKTLGFRGFSPDQRSDLLSQFELPKWTKSGRSFLRVGFLMAGLGSQVHPPQQFLEARVVAEGSEAILLLEQFPYTCQH